MMAQEPRRIPNWIPTPFFKKIHEHMPILCVDLVLSKGDKILLLRRADEPMKGRLYFPGGRVRKNETLHAACYRIAKEETGHDVVYPYELGTQEHFLKHDPFGHGRGTHTVSVLFHVTASQDQDVVIDKTSTSWKWVTAGDVSFLNGIHPSIKKFVKTVAEGRGSAHDC